MNTTIRNSALTATINHKGAELISLRSQIGKEYIWDGNPAFWNRHSPVLFPIVGSFKNNRYTFKDAAYELPRHGFARDLEFVLIEESNRSATFSLTHSDGTFLIFPFRFELQIKYTLDAENLLISYQVINHGNHQMPFSLGAHPAFALSEDFNNYTLEFEKSETPQYYLLDDGLLTENSEILSLDERKLRLDYSIFENDALVFKKLKSRSIVIFEFERPLVKIDLGNFPHLGIWTKQSARFLCIEPWFGFSDTLLSSGKIAEKEGIQILGPSEKFDAYYSIKTYKP